MKLQEMDKYQLVTLVDELHQKNLRLENEIQSGKETFGWKVIWGRSVPSISPRGLIINRLVFIAGKGREKM